LIEYNKFLLALKNKIKDLNSRFSPRILEYSLETFTARDDQEQYYYANSTIDEILDTIFHKYFEQFKSLFERLLGDDIEDIEKIGIFISILKNGREIFEYKEALQNFILNINEIEQHIH
jgi:hypothetical protein